MSIRADEVLSSALAFLARVLVLDVIANGLSHPFCHHLHVCVDTVFVGMTALMAPRHHASQIPEPIMLTGQRTTAVVLTGVHPSLFKSGAESSAVDEALVGLFQVAHFFAHQLYFGFSQNVWLGSSPLCMPPAGDEALFSGRELRPFGK